MKCSERHLCETTCYRAHHWRWVLVSLHIRSQFKDQPLLHVTVLWTPQQKKTFRSNSSLFCIFRVVVAGIMLRIWFTSKKFQVIHSNEGGTAGRIADCPQLLFAHFVPNAIKHAADADSIFSWRDDGMVGEWLSSIDQIVMATDSRWTLNGVVTWNNNSLFIPSSTNWNRVQHVQSW